MSSDSNLATDSDGAKHGYGGHAVELAPAGERSKLTMTETPVDEAASSGHAVASPVGSSVAGWLGGRGGPGAVRISILADGGARCLGSAVVERAEESRFGEISRLSAADLSKSITISNVVLDAERGGDIMPALLYLALRRGRIWERSTVAAYITESGRQHARFAGLEPLAKIPAHVQGESAPYIAVGQRIDLAIYGAYRAASSEMQAFLRAYFVPEAVETFEQWLGPFLKSSWFEAVYQGTLTREQYIYTLSNVHQFVRFTTRIIGRAVAYSTDRTLRNHWLNHLEGEINHEIIAEKDLEALGADVDFVVNAMVPNVSTQQFMVAQESMIGFNHDPVLLMGAPFVAEGYSGRLDGRLLEGLERCARGWGIAKPKMVTRFYASHIQYDGGSDGHWEHTQAMLGHCLTNDMQLQRFLNVIHLAKRSVEASYEDYIHEVGLFGASPQAAAT